LSWRATCHWQTATAQTRALRCVKKSVTYASRKASTLHHGICQSDARAKHERSLLMILLSATKKKLHIIKKKGKNETEEIFFHVKETPPHHHASQADHAAHFFVAVVEVGRLQGPQYEARILWCLQIDDHKVQVTLQLDPLAVQQRAIESQQHWVSERAGLIHAATVTRSDLLPSVGVLH
jgi:hypothetical protein